MAPMRFSIAVAFAAALLQTASAAHYFPRYWPDGSPASVTIVGTGFANPSSYAGLSLGGSACASVIAVSDSEVVCVASQTTGSGLAVSSQAGNIPPRAMVMLSNKLGIQTPPFGDAWKLSYLAATSEIVLHLNCRMKGGKVLINELSGSLECSSIDVNDWGQGSGASKFLYSLLPKVLSLDDPEYILRVSSSAATATLTIKFLSAAGSSGGDAAAQKLKEIFGNGQFHSSFGRIMKSMEYNGQRTELKLSGLDETMPGTHIFLIYLGCLAFVFLSRHALLWYRRRAKDPRHKLAKQERQIAIAKKNALEQDAAASHSV